MGKKRRSDKEAEREERRRKLKEGTTRSVIAVFFIVIAIVLVLSAFHKAGPAGEFVYAGVSYLVGFGYFVLPLLLVALAVSFFRTSFTDMNLFQIGGMALFLISGLGTVELLVHGGGGEVGILIATPLVAMVDLYASLVLFCGLLIISFLIAFDTELHLGIFRRLKTLFEKKPGAALPVVETVPQVTSFLSDTDHDDTLDDAADDVEDVDDFEAVPPQAPPTPKEVPTEEPDRGGLPNISQDYTPPPLSLLERDKGKPAVGDTKANANIIKRTLLNFGINVEMDEITVGPTVTRYALKPAEGVRLSKIVSLQSNLELALAAAPLRIEAPIPGKSLVGIEVPNSAKATLGLASLLGAPDFTESPKPLLITLGRDITGAPMYADVAKMPHAIIAGATGSGKSVTIHSVITSLLYRNGPESLRFIMIDPKRVELTLYKGIPHLITPVITDAKKAILALKWATGEMTRRYNVFEEHAVRDIGSYHTNVLAPAMKEYERAKAKNGEAASALPEQMPHIVVIIDELADIMQMYPRELEASIVRLAQMSRATGIHLLLSTQRPSVNVITGLIKANVPTRVALQVASQIDSRTILDTVGAEKLLGAGDMLYLASDMAKPRRMQSPFISEQEVKKVVQFLNKNNDYMLGDLIDFSSAEGNSGSEGGGGDDGDEDALYEDARMAVIRAGKASTSLLQRRLRVGYGRAARLIDILEERGVIGPSEGTNRPRDVLIKDTDRTLDDASS